MTFRTLILASLPLALMACEPAMTKTTGDEAVSVAAAASDVSMPTGLSGEQRSIWNTFSDAGKASVNACMANDRTFTACTAV